MIKFGVAGNSTSFYDDGYKHTYQAAAWCKEKGIDAYEYSFGKGIRITAETAKKIGDAFNSFGIELSIHAPYYINFANPDPQKLNSNVDYVLKSLESLKLFNNGNRIVIHPATQGKLTRSESFSIAYKNLEYLATIIYDKKLTDKKICLETMGKISQIGDEKEIAELCKIAPFYYPCIDFGHLNARTFGSIKSETDYQRIIEYLLENLDFDKVKYMHIHFSKIMYGKSGELKHLTFSDNTYGPEFEPLANIIKKYELEPIIICESDGTQAEDSMTMKKIFFGNRF